MKRLLSAAALVAFLAFAVLPAHAEEAKPDDQVVFSLAAENWVTTKTARVSLGVEAAVTSNTAGTMRAAMNKAVNDIVKADWRLVAFNRSQDQTGMDRWSASFEARVPENELNNLNENAKKASKAGMQVTVNGVDFSPTMEEMQAAYALLRTQIYKQANDQLAALNTALPGRNYRIALIDFVGGDMVPSPIRTMKTLARPMMMEMAAKGAADMGGNMPPMEKSEKVELTARVILASVPPVPAK